MDLFIKKVTINKITKFKYELTGAYISDNI